MASRSLRAVSKFLDDGRLKTKFNRAVDAVSPFVNDELKTPWRTAVEHASKVDRTSGLPPTR